MNRFIVVAAASAAVALAGLALASGPGAVAQNGMHGPGQTMPGMPGPEHMMPEMHGGGPMPDMHGGGTASEDNPATAAYKAAAARMHEDMAIAYSGDADTDFVRGMIPHHRGAIDMAKVAIAFGEDPEIRKLALDIVAAQEREIAGMEAWLKAKGR